MMQIFQNSIGLPLEYNHQGGKQVEGNDVLITFPIAFQRKVLGIQATKGWGVNALVIKK